MHHTHKTNPIDPGEFVYRRDRLRRKAIKAHWLGMHPEANELKLIVPTARVLHRYGHDRLAIQTLLRGELAACRMGVSE